MSTVCSGSALLTLFSCLSVIQIKQTNKKNPPKSEEKKKKLSPTIWGFSGVIRVEATPLTAAGARSEKHVNTALSASNIIHDPRAACSDGEKTVYFHVLCTFELFLQDQNGTSPLLK